MKEVGRRSRITTIVVDAEPAIIVSWMQEEGETIVDLRDEFILLGVTMAKVSR